jgi:hypothetical protein
MGADAIPWYDTRYVLVVFGDWSQTATVVADNTAIELRPFVPGSVSQIWQLVSLNNFFSFWSQVSTSTDKYYLTIDPTTSIVKVTNNAANAASFVALKRPKGYRILALVGTALKPLTQKDKGLLAADQSDVIFGFTQVMSRT